MGAAEVELNVEFLFEQIGAALGITEIFGHVAAGLHLEGDGSALEGGMQTQNTLQMGVVQAFGDADNGGKSPRDALVVVIESGIRTVMAGGLRFAIVITNDGRDDVAVAPFEAGNVAIEGEIFPMFVVTAMADAMTDIVKESTSLQLNA